MLEPQTRATLAELLRPPTGFQLKHAVGTTFTISLDTALAVPLAFASYRATSDEDPISILDAIRRVVDRVDLFAQAGEASISYPPTRLVAFLEPMFHPVAVPSGIFHPKVWFIEFQRDQERRYRYVCSSRNLTADRSWDLVVSLDGVAAPPERRADAEKTNAPIVGLLRSLPDFAVLPLDLRRRTPILDLADAVSGVEWERPDHIESVSHHVWGISNPTFQSRPSDRSLIISPFVTQGGITQMRGDRNVPTTLVSRAESLNAINPGYFDEQVSSFVVDDAANLTETDHEDDPASTALAGTPGRLEGLHAKIVVHDRGSRSHLLTGSLNATDAGLHQNVEAMVELVGQIAHVGVDAIVASLGNLIVPYDIEPADSDDSRDQERDARLERIIREMASSRFHVQVISGDTFGLSVWLERPMAVPPSIEIEWYVLHRQGLPISGMPGLAEQPTLIDELALDEVSPFIVLKVQDDRGPTHARRTVVIAELHDDPPDRREAVIASQFTDRAAFLRFLALLLELGGMLPAGGALAPGRWGASLSGSNVAGLFEMLVEALGAKHRGLNEVQRIVSFLRSQGNDASLLPDGFDDLWRSIWSTYQLLNPEEKRDQR